MTAMRNDEKYPSAYYLGRAERENLSTPAANPHVYLTRLWSWWLAGWNDRDIELQ